MIELPANIISETLIATWGVITLSSPGLLLGLLLAGIIRSCIPKEKVERYLRPPGLPSVALASAAGVPLPLCSCSVIPVGLELRRAGASKGATASFFISTPEVGVDSFSLSWGLLGPSFAFARLVSAAGTAFFVGALIDRFCESEPSQESNTGVSPQGECCRSEPAPCCAKPTRSTAPATTKRASLIASTFRYGFKTQLDELATTLAVGFILSGFIAASLPDGALTGLGMTPILSMVVVFLISLPTYVCASASTPLAAVLLMKGLDPSAAFVFLLAGPASNITTMLAIRKELGTKEFALYLIGVAICTFSFALLFRSTLIGQFTESILHNHMSASPIETALGVLFTALLILSLLRKIKPEALSRA